LGRRTNYSFEKRQKEIARAKKKEQKLELKRARKDAAAESGVDPDIATPEEMQELLQQSDEPQDEASGAEKKD
jgi:hypothetical protein